jgi:uncharacterized coiled-coil protein SlyX
MDERLTAIEIALAHAEAAIEDLSGVVREQDARIRQLERALAGLAERIAAAETRSGPEPEVPPPHY